MRFSLILFWWQFTFYGLTEAYAPKDLIRLAPIYLDYFRFHAVSSVTVIVCHENSWVKYRDVRYLLHYLMASNLYVRLYDGHQYEKIASYEWNCKMSFFGPPCKFRTDNSTRQPLDFHREPLSHKTGILMLHLDSACALNVLRWAAAAENNFFNTNHFWLLNFRKASELELLEDSEIFLPPDSEVRLLRTGESDQFDLIDVYKVHAMGRLKSTHIGTSRRAMLGDLRAYGSAISYRRNLEGITFNTGLVIAFPDMFTDIEDVRWRHIDTIAKVNHRLFAEMCNKLNMRYNTYQTDNYGWHQADGSFDGLVGRFQRYELDFGQLAIFMRLDRVALVDYISETYRIRAGLMFRQPPLSAVANIFTMPFSADVWLAILALIVVTVLVLFVQLLLSPYNRLMDFWDCVVFMWGAVCQQGFYQNITNRSGRIIIFTSFMATLFLYTSFSANIVALLQSPSAAIKSLGDLSQSPLEIGVQDTVYNKVYFNESTDPVTNFLYHKKIAPKGNGIYMRPLIGMQKMRHGLFAYQVELQAGYQIIGNTFSEPEKCGLKEIEPFQLPMLGFPTRKNFPYKELFRRQLRTQREVGLMKREELKWFPQKPKCEGGVGGFVSIGLTECRHAFQMLGLGMAASILIYVLEVTLKRFITFGQLQRRKHQKIKAVEYKKHLRKN